MVSRNSSNFIYGGEVFVQQRKRINSSKWKGDSYCNCFLTIIKKDVDYFKIWGSLKGKSYSLVTKETDDELDPEVQRKVGFKKDDFIQEPNGRVYYWSKVCLDLKSHVTNGRGHGKQQGFFKGNTYCARDKGRTYLSGRKV